MNTSLNSDEKLQIMRFICAFAWADLKVVSAEKHFIEQFSIVLELSENEKNSVKSWIKHPPRPEEIDPFSISPHLKETIIAAAKAISMVDGDFDSKEAELLNLLSNLI
ncbi:MAG: hypothetical protein VXZ96_02635 [Myxococcota bacterium]|nr:hypothetical protein [Myxococcota bacterium]